MIIWPAKDPAATENFAFEFAATLGGEEISTQLLVADGATVSGATIEGTSVPFELSGGTRGTVAKVSCTATLSDGRILVEMGVLPIGGEPISLADAKTALVIERDDEDVALAGYLRAAVGHIERATGKNLTPKIVAQTLDGFPLKPCDPRHPRGPLPIWLLQGPASEVLSIEYDDPDGVTQSLTSFRLVPGRNAKLLPAYGACWPITACGEGTVRLTYVAGYDPTELPPELTQAALMLFGHFNANREAVIAGDRAASVELPLGVAALIFDYCPR